jgi:hypothetical protein
MAKKENLENLLEFILDLSKKKENLWWKSSLLQRLLSESSGSEKEIKAIYELCVKNIIREHAERFYQNFPLPIKDSLINDFVRMENFRREDNFIDFSLAAYQQMEAIVNYLCKEQAFKEFLTVNWNNPCRKRYDKANDVYINVGETLGSLICFGLDYASKVKPEEISNPIKLFFNRRLRGVLYYYSFNCDLPVVKSRFDVMSEVGSDLTIIRNQNHRQTEMSDYQKNVFNKIMPNQHKYYFKFMGFLEEFISTIQENYDNEN